MTKADRLENSDQDKRRPRTGREHNTEPLAVAYNGPVNSRTPHDSAQQGISSNSSADESQRQEKAAERRDDAKAGVNHSRKRAA